MEIEGGKGCKIETEMKTVENKLLTRGRSRKRWRKLGWWYGQEIEKVEKTVEGKWFGSRKRGETVEGGMVVKYKKRRKPVEGKWLRSRRRGENRGRQNGQEVEKEEKTVKAGMAKR